MNALSSENKRPPFVRFSLLSLLLVVSLLGVSVSHFQASRTIRRLEAERFALRRELGYLDIQDRKMAYVKRLGSLDELTWRYRVYLPPEGTYRVNVALRWAGQGFPQPKHKVRAFQGGEEFLLTAAFRRGADGKWVLRIATPWVGSNVPDKDGQLEWLSEPWADKSAILPLDQEAFAPDEPIEIGRWQATRTAAMRGAAADRPTDGFMLWFEPVDWSESPAE